MWMLATSMALQPDVRAYLGCSWMLDPQLAEFLPNWPGSRAGWRNAGGSER